VYVVAQFRFSGASVLDADIPPSPAYFAGCDECAGGDSGRIWAGFAAPASGVKIEAHFRVDFLAWRTVVSTP